MDPIDNIDELPPPPVAPAAGVPAIDDASELPPPPDSLAPVDSIEHLPPPIASERDLSISDMEAIAQKHGVDVEDLRDLAPYYGAVQTPRSFGEAMEFGAKGVAGSAGRMLLGVPQFVMKKMQAAPMRAALDEMAERGNERRGYVEAAAEMLASPAVSVLGKTAGTAARVAEATGMGAVAGVAGSREGEEIASGVIGAGLGLGLGGALAGGSRFLAGRAANRATAPAEEAIEEVVQKRGADFEKAVQAEIDSRRGADAVIEKQLLDPAATALTNQERKLLLDTYAPGQVEQSVAEALRAGAKQSADELTEAAEKRLATRIINDAGRDMAADARVDLTGADSVAKRLQEWAGLGEGSGQGMQWARNQLRTTLDSRTAQEYLIRNGIGDTTPSSSLSNILDRVSDAQNTIRSMDEKWKGLGAEAAHKELNRGINQMSGPREAAKEKLRTIFVENARTEARDQLARNGRSIIEKLSNTDADGNLVEKLTAEEEAVYRPFAKFFEEQLGELNRAADAAGIPRLDIKQTRNYLPAQMVDPERLQAIVQDRVDNILRDARQLSGRPYQNLAQLPGDVYKQVVSRPEHASTVSFIRTLSGESGQLPSDVQRAYSGMFTSKAAGGRMATVAKAALQREDALPVWARETDLYKLADKWNSNTLRHIYLRGGMSKLRAVGQKLRALNDNSRAEYIEDLLQDLTGYRPGTASALGANVFTPYLQKIDRAIARTEPGSPKRILLESARGIPAYLQETSRNVYKNVLETANLKAVVQNLTQTFTKTLPELGPKYGPLLFFRGMARVGNLKNLPAVVKRMEAMGLAPVTVRTSPEYLAQGMARSPVFRKLGRASEQLSRIGAIPYRASESLNRAIAFGASEMMANDLMRGSKFAQSALARFPTSVQREARAAISGGDMAGLVRSLSEHIVNNTQYQYNRASQAQYIRTLGPLFSTFSKWPTATFGQVVGAYRDRGALGATGKLAQELVLPFVALETVDQLLMAYNGEDQLSDRQKKVLGNEGLSQAAPIGNLRSIASGDLLTPPIIDSFVATVIDPMKQETTEDMLRKALKGGANATYMFAPGGAGGWVRLITDDLVTHLTGERPEGTNYFERTVEGARQLEKKLK